MSSKKCPLLEFKVYASCKAFPSKGIPIYIIPDEILSTVIENFDEICHKSGVYKNCESFCEMNNQKKRGD